MSNPQTSPAEATATALNKRRSAVQRMAVAPLASMRGGSLADVLGEGSRQRLLWLGLLAMPLLFPIALPGMASAVGTLCLIVAIGLCRGQAVPLPRWLASLVLSPRVQGLLVRVVSRSIGLVAQLSRPRLLSLSNKSFRLLNGLMLCAAGLAMVVPVPIISFDNVLPALAIVLMAWGLRLRDGLMLLTGYLATATAVVSVMLLWWGGSLVAQELLVVVSTWV